MHKISIWLLTLKTKQELKMTKIYTNGDDGKEYIVECIKLDANTATRGGSKSLTGNIKCRTDSGEEVDIISGGKFQIKKSGVILTEKP
jgi:hypothetical protein